MTIEERLAAVEQRQDRIDKEHVSLLERTVEPLAELTETLDLTKQHMDARLTEILGSAANVDVTNPALLAIVNEILKCIDFTHKRTLDAVTAMFAKMNAAMAGRVGED